MSDFSDRLRKALEKTRTSQRELAGRTGLTETTISRYLSGAREPKASIIEDIAEQLEIPVSDLIGNDQDEGEDEAYALTPFGCLLGVLNDYGIDTSRITPKVGEHMVNDLFEMMEKSGILRKVEHDV